MPERIGKQYDFKSEEGRIYERWEESGFLNPDNIQSGKRYCNILPPPNANGELHIGHASGYAVMDIFGRFERMNGKKVLLLPGKDHAGIQTQVVFEKKLKAERNIGRQDLGREKFYQECFDFCKKSADYMRAQEKRIGIGADWSREKFTLDPDVSRIAVETFVKMYQDGLIYKGKRIINWCSRCVTALSDVEVAHKESEGALYYIKYPIKDSKEFITVATTRPETMLGDTAVAVNSKDKRYLSLIGHGVILPLQEREIPIIADRRIEMEFGTGAVKITPAHDPLDWRIGKDHNLEEIQVIDEKAEITAEGGKYEGMKVPEARREILKALDALGLLEKEEALKVNVSVCERCKTVVEPLISEQWFVQVDAKKYSLKKKALEAVRAGKINFYPENFKKIMIQWLLNLDDWCISRQIWWGHRMPVWRKEGQKSEKEVYVGIEPPKGEGWIQDDDTFDTWFSSGQWPYSTLGYDKGKDYQNFYPTDMMVMGRDILFFWAARMIMLGLYRTGKLPFKNLYLTGLVRDREGRKMSKSRGNGIDPLQMVEKYGADALRLSLVMDIAPGQDSRLYEEKIEGFRNFVTKLWNVFRYADQSDENFSLAEKISRKDLKTLADKWIVSELEETIAAVTNFLKNKDISLAQERLRRFIWDKLADWYVEIHKVEKNTQVLGYVLDKILKLWHPFTPFVTEKIFQDLGGGQNILMRAAWPKAQKKFLDKKAEKDFRDLQELVGKIRNLRAGYHISPAEVIGAFAKKINNAEIIEKLARVKISAERSKEKTMRVSSRKRALDLNVGNLIDAKKELDSIQKEIKNLESLVAKNETMLKNKNFAQSAPEKIVEATNGRLEEYREKLVVKKSLEKDLRSFI